MTDRFANSRRLFERAQQSIAAGVSSGIRKMEQPVPLYFQPGEGCRVCEANRDGSSIAAAGDLPATNRYGPSLPWNTLPDQASSSEVVRRVKVSWDCCAGIKKTKIEEVRP